ncbi:HAMP domain-containing protein [Treponema bryantii]|uniref:histidine kinase n=1 Tax=Treponema bryantii TaxID=163 RepID=A0A1I3KNL7_9SPIR|nr:histidine kinase [Treponema bryantii]SFI74111.1 HAMP domain-containing protein [Treponema bryantii]
MKFNPINYIRNKSLRWRIMMCIGIAILMLVASLLTTMRLSLYSMSNLGDSYKSNSELTHFSQAVTTTEKAMEDYVNYRTFESIDAYYNARTKIEDYFEKFQELPSKNDVAHKEYIVHQLTEAFLYYSNLAISARRANNEDEIQKNYTYAMDSYNYLISQVLELNNLRLQQNAERYDANQSKIVISNTLGIVFFLVFSVMIFFVLYITITSIMEPLVEISEVAHKVARRNFDVPLFNRESNDEIGNICKAFDRMIISIREYIDTIWEKARTEAELKEKEIEMQALYTDAQLRALQNQINPHFLFNTLNTGAQLAMMENADKTCYFIEQVADFFRYNIQQQSRTVSIDEELALVDNFVYIMKVRFGNRLEFIKNIPEGTFPQQIPSMTLQPLVENCIKHGLKNAKGIISLEVSVEEKNIVISISDNGEGMPQKTRDAVFKAVMAGTTRLPDDVLDDNSTHNGTGLISVFLRLQLQFHRYDLFDITDAEGGGTKFIIRIPKHV